MSEIAPASWRPALAAALLAPALYVVRFGYAFGYSDQDEFLPWLMHRMDPSLLSTDWFVGVQESGFNVRSGFLAVLEPIASTLGVEPAVAMLYGAAWLILGLAVYDLMLGVTRSPAASLLGTIATLVVLPRWTIGGNALTSSMLVPSMLAWSLASSAVAIHFRGRMIIPGLLLGAAAWIQPLVSLVVGTTLLVAGFVRGRSVRGAARESLRLAIPAMVLVVPIAVLYLVNRPAPVTPGFKPDFADMLMRFRAPHHYLPTAFPIADWLRVGVLTVVGVGGLRVWMRTGSPAQVRYMVAVLLTSAAFVAAGILGSAVRTIGLAQPFKVTVLSGVVLSALALGGAVKILRARHAPLLRSLDRWISHAVLPVGAAMLVVAATFLVSPRTIPDADLATAADWLREQSDTRVTVAVPPSTSGFRYRSGRGVVVTFKAVPFGPADAAAWYRRLSDMAPGAMNPSGFAAGPLLEQLDDAYEGLSGSALDVISERYGVDWLVRRTPIEPDPDGWSLASRHGSTLVYRRRQEVEP